MRTHAIDFAASDYDGTLFDTFAPSPRGIDVHRACDMALERLFGESGMLAALGGLRNRAPIELVHDALKLHALLRVKGVSNYLAHYERLTKMDGPGAQLHPITDDNCLVMLGEMFVRLKLEILLEEIRDDGGKRWPHPCDGALEFLKRLGERHIPVAIISSGHDLFIKRCFELWRAPCPEIRLTDDDLRMQPLPLEEKVKPHPALFQKLREKMGDTKMLHPIYFGDDPVKDGGLAHNAGVPFGWYNPHGKVSGDLRPGDVQFKHWRDVIEMID